MKIKNKLLSTFVAASLAISAGSAMAAEKIRFATEGAWAPFNFIDETGKPQGFDVDIADALCEKLQAECEMVTQDWDGLIPGLKVRKFDAIIASMSITEERQRVVDFTDPYYSGGLRFVAAKDKSFDTAVESLKGKTIGAQRATVGGIYLEDKLSDVVNVKLYDTNDSVYLDLKSGRLDGALSDELPTYEWLKNEPGYEYKGEAFNKNDKIGIAVRKNDQELRDKLNRALQAIVADGTYAKINAKYFPFSIY